MPHRFPVSHFRPGMRLKTDIFYDGSLLLPAGTTLADRHINQLRSWAIETVETQENLASFAEVVEAPEGEGSGEPVVLDISEIEKAAAPEPPPLPKGYATQDGKTYVVEEDLPSNAPPIKTDLSLVFQGAIGAGNKIESEASIQVAGEVAEGCTLIARGEITCGAPVTGTDETAVSLTAPVVTLSLASYCQIDAAASIKASGLVHCRARAGKEILVSGSDPGILGGDLEAGETIAAGCIAEHSGEPAVVRITMARYKKLYLNLERLDRTAEARRKERESLEKVIQVIKLLGEKVVDLPPEKKQELAMQSKRYMELKKELSDLALARQRLEEELAREYSTVDECPVRFDSVRPSVKIVIGTAELTVNSRQNRIGYYLHKGRILAATH